MNEVFAIIEDWLSKGKQMAVATVTGTWGSSPRPVGSVLLVGEDGDMAGSVSGGCVENSVVKAALNVLKTGVPKQLHYGISNDEAWEVGLMCGGKLDVFVEPFPAGETREQMLSALRENRGGVLLSRMDTESSVQQFFSPDSDQWSTPDGQLAHQAWTERKSQILETEGATWFARVLPRKHRLLIIGAAHIAVELVQLAKLFDFEMIIIDPRQVFVEKTQFPEAPHQMIVDWPAEVLPDFELDAYTYAVLLTHDPKIDDQALHLLLNSNIGYIGALGSKRTHEKRVARLREAGVDEAKIARIHAPVGLNIGAKGAREIALSIIAEIVKFKNS